MRRKRKFEAVQRMYLKERDEKNEEDILRAFLDKRRNVVFEICTRSYEEERRKVEDEIVHVNDLLYIIILHAFI